MNHSIAARKFSGETCALFGRAKYLLFQLVYNQGPYYAPGGIYGNCDGALSSTDGILILLFSYNLLFSYSVNENGMYFYM